MFRRVRKNFIIFIRTAKWKKSVDESVNFNEVDLLDPEETENMENLKKFAQDNNFNGCFRSSAKTGQNISESMEYLILEIIKKMEEIASKGTDGYVNDRQSVTLDPDKHNQEADQKRKRSNGGCCG